MNINSLIEKAKKINDIKVDKFNKVKNTIRVGIMGGTFNPIHNGHLAVAQYLKEEQELDYIMFIPAGDPPHKQGNITNKSDRYNMVLMAAKNNEDFIVSDIEINRNKKTYTVDTLRELIKLYDNIDIYFIIGADNIFDIESWKDVDENFKLCKFIGTTRPGITLDNINKQIIKLEKKYNAKITTTVVPSIDISSTYIRNRIDNENSIKYLVPENVELYIKEFDLYNK